MAEKQTNRWFGKVTKSIKENCLAAEANLKWLQEQMYPYLSITMHDEAEAIGSLALQLQKLKSNKRLVLRDAEYELMLNGHLRRHF